MIENMNINYMRGKPVPDPTMDNVWRGEARTPPPRHRVPPGASVYPSCQARCTGATLYHTLTGKHYPSKSNNLFPRMPEGLISQPRPDRYIMNDENALHVTRDLHKTSSNHKQCQKTYLSLQEPHT